MRRLRRSLGNIKFFFTYLTFLRKYPYKVNVRSRVSEILWNSDIWVFLPWHIAYQNVNDILISVTAYFFGSYLISTGFFQYFMAKDFMYKIMEYFIYQTKDKHDWWSFPR